MKAALWHRGNRHCPECGREIHYLKDYERQVSIRTALLVFTLAVFAYALVEGGVLLILMSLAQALYIMLDVVTMPAMQYCRECTVLRIVD